MSEQRRMTPEPGRHVVVVRPPSEVMSRQRLPYFVGVSGATTGAQGLSMNMIVIPPGGAAEPHIHQGYETAIYLLQGRVETRYGPGCASRSSTRRGSSSSLDQIRRTSPST